MFDWVLNTLVTLDQYDKGVQDQEVAVNHNSGCTKKAFL